MDTVNLIAEIDNFLATSGMAESTFGRTVVNDWKFVRSLRQGRRVWPDTERKVRHFISTFAAEPQSQAQELMAAPKRDQSPDDE